MIFGSANETKLALLRKKTEKDTLHPPRDAHEYRRSLVQQRDAESYAAVSRARDSRLQSANWSIIGPGESIHRRFTHTRVINDRGDSG